MKISNYSDKSNTAFVFFVNKEVDLDTLNVLAAGSVDMLCKCQYKTKYGTHIFEYEVNQYEKIYEKMLYDDCPIDYINAVYEAVELSQSMNLTLGNFILQRDCIFIDNAGAYRFIYIPLVRKGTLSAKKFILKALGLIDYPNDDLCEFIEQLKAEDDDEIVIEMLKHFANSGEFEKYNEFSADIYWDNVSENETTVLTGNMSESETTVLSSGGSESETTILSSGGSESETTILSSGKSESETTVLSSGGNESETTVLSRSGNEFETTILSRGGNESETTVLSREERAEYTTADDSKVLSDAQNELTAFYYNNSRECETTLLSEIVQDKVVPQSLNGAGGSVSGCKLILVRNNTGENIVIHEGIFRIGKDQQNVDYYLNNDTISRIHAVITCIDGEYQIEDNNSTNGTYVEGIRLSPPEKAELDDGYLLSLGNESFQVFIERG